MRSVRLVHLLRGEGAGLADPNEKPRKRVSVIQNQNGLFLVPLTKEKGLCSFRCV